MRRARFDKFSLFFCLGMNDVTHVVTSIGYPLVTVGYSIGYKRWLHHAFQIAQKAIQKIYSGSLHGYKNMAHSRASCCDLDFLSGVRFQDRNQGKK